MIIGMAKLHNLQSSPWPMRHAPNIASWVLALFGGAFAGSGCAVKVYSPPAMTSLDHNSQLRAGQTAVTASAQLGKSAANPDTDLYGGQIQVARGVIDGLQLSGELSAAQLVMPDGTTGGALADGTTAQIMGRLAAKTPLLRPTRVNVRGDHSTRVGLAINAMAGIGAGHIIDAGTIASFDAGVAAAYENCVITPGLGAAYYFSGPLSRETIYARSEGSINDQPPAFAEYELPQTQGALLSGSLAFETSPSKCRADAARLQIAAALQIWHAFAGGDDDATSTGSIALRYRF